jgi:hypothetical protein
MKRLIVLALLLFPTAGCAAAPLPMQDGTPLHQLPAAKPVPK